MSHRGRQGAVSPNGRDHDGYGSGYTTDSRIGAHHNDPAVPGSGFASGLEDNGLSTSAVYVGILKGKVRAQEQELTRMRTEVRDSSNRTSGLAAQVADLKRQNIDATKALNTKMDQLAECEDRLRKLEDDLDVEERGHNDTRSALHHLKQSSQRQAEDAEHELRMVRESEAELKEHLRNATARLQTLEHDPAVARQRETLERLRGDKEQLLYDFRAAVDRLARVSEDDETSVFVARSTVQTAVAELEARLEATEAHLQAAQEAYQSLSLTDRDTHDFLKEVLRANKDHWKRISSLQFEVERLTGSLALAQQKAEDAEGPAKEHAQRLEEQLRTAQSSAEQCRATIDMQTRAQRDLQDRLQEALDEGQLLQSRLNQALSDKASAQRGESEALAKARDSEEQLAEEETKRHEAEREVITLRHDVSSLDEQLRMAQEEAQSLLISHVSKLRSELEDARRDAKTSVSRADDFQEQLRRVTEDRDMKETQILELRNQMEALQTDYQRTLQSELESHKQLFEQEYQEAQDRLAKQSEEITAANRELERYRTDVHALTTQIERAGEESKTHRKDVADAAATIQRLEERVRALKRDADAAKQTAASAQSLAAEQEGTISHLRGQLSAGESRRSADSNRGMQRSQFLESQVALLEGQKVELTEEVRKLRLHSAGEKEVEDLRGKWERDRTKLMEENQRVQQQYLEAQKTNSSLQATIAHLKQRLGTTIQLQAQLDDARRSGAELPILRQQLDELQTELKETQEEAKRLQEQRDALARHMETLAEQSGTNTSRRDRDMERVLRQATAQVRRAERVVEESSHISANRSRRGSSVSPVQHQGSVSGRHDY